MENIFHSDNQKTCEELMKEKIHALEEELEKFRLQEVTGGSLVVRSENEIAPAGDLFRAVWEKCADGMRLTDQDGAILMVNQALCEMMQMERRQLEGKTVAALYRESDRTHIIESHKRRFASRTVETHFIREMTLWNGNVIWVEVTNSFLEFEGHRTVLLSIFRDVTSRKQDELKLNNYASELTALNATKDKFFSIIAHDLRGPINALVSLSELAIEDFESLPPDEVKFYMENINKASKGIVNHLENLLHWSRLNSGRMPFNPEKTDLREISENVISLVEGSAVSKKIEIIDNIGKDCYVFADRNMLTSVLQNLISNAVKFTSAGGRVTLASAESDNFFTVSVSDTGIGISQNNIEKLFRIDVHHTTIGTGDEKGSGLGLILCKELIGRNGGSIRVESEKEKGSSFIFTLEKYSGQT